MKTIKYKYDFKKWDRYRSYVISSIKCDKRFEFITNNYILLLNNYNVYEDFDKFEKSLLEFVDKYFDKNIKFKFSDRDSYYLPYMYDVEKFDYSIPDITFVRYLKDMYEPISIKNKIKNING